MVDYQDFVALSQSHDSEERGRAAHLAALAYLSHEGPASEHAALYAALIGFLEDPSVRVRGALAYGLLRSREAPRPILLALLQDTAVIARAIVQYSPALIDADLIGLIRTADRAMLEAAALREHLSARCVAALIARGDRDVTLALLRRDDLTVLPATLTQLVAEYGAGDGQMRGALLARDDLPGTVRLQLVEAATAALRGARIVAGAIAPPRLERLLTAASDTALTRIGERDGDGRGDYAASLASGGRLSIRVLLHAIVSGHVMFFAACLAALGDTPAHKVFTILQTGSRAALNALLARCGLPVASRNVIARLVVHAREADLVDDAAARHFIVTAVTEELIVEHEGVIPPELEEAFAYLSDQNVALARQAARGVLQAFSQDNRRLLPGAVDRIALPAA